MPKYIFILGNHPELSKAEIFAVQRDLIPFFETKQILIVESKSKINAEALLERLGGTVKIGELLGETTSLRKLDLTEIVELKNKTEKIIYGFSLYSLDNVNPGNFSSVIRAIGLEYKKHLKQEGYKVRLVESREQTLSSVIIQKEKCQDLLILFSKNTLYYGRTLSSQKFQDYSARDYGRPNRDFHSGMLPPKLAKMMLNLSGANFKDKLLDPFCGSGTILQEALLMGFTDLIGTDISEKAITDTNDNLAWLQDKIKFAPHQLKIFACDILELKNKLPVQSIASVVGEGYLGPVKGTFRGQLPNLILELTAFYTQAFKALTTLLKPGARLVLALPAWKEREEIRMMLLKPNLEKLGYKLNKIFIYGRPDAQVLRQIYVLTYAGHR